MKLSELIIIFWIFYRFNKYLYPLKKEKIKKSMFLKWLFKKEKYKDTQNIKVI